MVHAEAFSRPLSRNEVVGLIFRLTIFGAVTYFTIKWMVDAIDPTRKQKVEAQKQVGKKLKYAFFNIKLIHTIMKPKTLIICLWTTLCNSDM